METGATGSTYRSFFGIVVALVAAGVAVVVLVDAAIRGGWSVFALALPWAVSVMWLLWVGVVASSVRVRRDGVRVQNLLRVTRASWSAIAEIGSRWQLRLVLIDGTRVECLAAPVRARPGGRPTPVERDLESIRELWSGEQQGSAIIERSWDIPLLSVGAIAVVWTLLATLLTAA